mmetsp:Transcript_51555/g.122629  ORF Transcript_51555/g.122629 Transcript_51555/m.122629 type:complete len:652 (-) Transcript_51555:5-1960(-)
MADSFSHDEARAHFDSSPGSSANASLSSPWRSSRHDSAWGGETHSSFSSRAKRRGSKSVKLRMDPMDTPSADSRSEASSLMCRSSSKRSGSKRSALHTHFDAAATALEEVLSSVNKTEKAAAHAVRIQSQYDQGVAHGSKHLKLEERAEMIRMESKHCFGDREGSHEPTMMRRPSMHLPRSMSRMDSEPVMDRRKSMPAIPSPTAGTYKGPSLSARRREFEGQLTKAESLERLREACENKEAVDPEVTPFLKRLEELGNGIVGVAWRRHFETEDSSSVEFPQFCTGLSALQIETDAVNLWRRLAGTGKTLGIESVDEESADILDFFVAWCKPTLGGPIEVFEAMDSDASDSLLDKDFVDGLSALGFFDDPSLPEKLETPEKVCENLYPLLDQRGLGTVGRFDILFLERDEYKKELFRSGFQFSAQKGRKGMQVTAPPSHEAHSLLNRMLRSCVSGNIWREKQQLFREAPPKRASSAGGSSRRPLTAGFAPAQHRCEALIGKEMCGLVRLHSGVEAMESSSVERLGVAKQSGSATPFAAASSSPKADSDSWAYSGTRSQRPMSAPQRKPGHALRAQPWDVRTAKLKWHGAQPHTSPVVAKEKIPFDTSRVRDFLRPSRAGEIFRFYEPKDVASEARDSSSSAPKASSRIGGA